jgi:hypothetical protein
MTGWLRSLKDHVSNRGKAQRPGAPERAEKKARAEALHRQYQREYKTHRK